MMTQKYRERYRVPIGVTREQVERKILELNQISGVGAHLVEYGYNGEPHIIQYNFDTYEQQCEVERCILAGFV